MGQRERYLELHSEFRNRYMLFHLDDGTVKDSRLVNWRRVEWERVVRIEARVHGKVHEVTCKHDRFKFFMNFKVCRVVAGVQSIYWVIGWTDGETAFLKSIAFKTGLLERKYQQPLSGIEGHIHPRVQGMVAGDKPGARTQAELRY